MSYIDLENGCYGKYGDSCGDGHGCTYCEMLCPTGAIYPDPPYEVAAPVGEEHPYEMFYRILDQAEKEGKFRKLLPYEEVGTTTPYYSTHPKHPRIRPLSTKDDNGV